MNPAYHFLAYLQHPVNSKKHAWGAENNLLILIFRWPSSGSGLRPMLPKATGVPESAQQLSGQARTPLSSSKLNGRNSSTRREIYSRIDPVSLGRWIQFPILLDGRRSREEKETKRVGVRKAKQPTVECREGEEVGGGGSRLYPVQGWDGGEEKRDSTSRGDSC